MAYFEPVTEANVCYPAGVRKKIQNRNIRARGKGGMIISVIGPIDKVEYLIKGMLSYD
jgi:hypothetical protein